MAHTLSWETQNPGLMIFLVDQSSSMRYSIGNRKKSEIVVENIISILDALVATCQKGSKIREKFKCVIIGYNNEAHILYDKTPTAIQNDLDTGNTILQVVETGLTNMADAFAVAKKVIDTWMSEQRRANKPMPAPRIVNITDGLPEIKGITDEEARNKTAIAAQEVTSIQTEDGNVILANIFIHDTKIAFPISVQDVSSNIKEDWAKKNAEFLFRISSEVTEALCTNADSHKLHTQIGSKLLLCSNKPEDILYFTDFASHPSENKTSDNYVYPSDLI